MSYQIPTVLGLYRQLCHELTIHKGCVLCTIDILGTDTTILPGTRYQVLIIMYYSYCTWFWQPTECWQLLGLHHTSTLTIQISYTHIPTVQWVSFCTTWYLVVTWQYATCNYNLYFSRNISYKEILKTATMSCWNCLKSLSKTQLQKIYLINSMHCNLHINK